MATNEFPLRYDIEVSPSGRIEVQTPFAAGSHVTVYVVEQQPELIDVVAASVSSTDFWNNPEDDEDWNNA